MKVLLVAFALLSLATSQTPPTNGTTHKGDLQHTDFRKCVWEKCSLFNCSCEYVLSEEVLTYNNDKLGICMPRERFWFIISSCSTDKSYKRFNRMLLCFFNRSDFSQVSFPSLTVRYAFWIIGFFVIAGNAYVIVRSFVRTSCFKQAWPSASLQCNHIVILNIAVADFIMGIYLITISTINVVYSGLTTFFDTTWNGSLPCSVLGSLTVISSEASCLLMVTLTSFRLFHIYRPLSSMTASSWPWKVSIFMSWSVAVFLGVFPILESSDYFVQYYSMKNALGEFRPIGKSLIKEFAFTLASLDRSNYSNHEFKPEIAYINRYFPLYASRAQFEYSVPSSLSYQDFKIQRNIVIFMNNYFLNYTPEAKFGFYSESVICLPRFFVLPGYSGWEYTIALITLNFTCSVFIAVSYILIYIRSIKQCPINAASTVDLRKRESKMQKRIAKIIITDCACWVPICIMSFAVFGGWKPCNGPLIYETTAGFLLPINSALNPFLHSVSLNKLFKRLGCRPITRCRN